MGAERLVGNLSPLSSESPHSGDSSEVKDCWEAFLEMEPRIVDDFEEIRWWVRYEVTEAITIVWKRKVVG